MFGSALSLLSPHSWLPEEGGIRSASRSGVPSPAAKGIVRQAAASLVGGKPAGFKACTWLLPGFVGACRAAGRVGEASPCLGGRGRLPSPAVPQLPLEFSPTHGITKRRFCSLLSPLALPDALLRITGVPAPFRAACAGGVSSAAPCRAATDAGG